jgi:hypothetical protein
VRLTGRSWCALLVAGALLPVLPLAAQRGPAPAWVHVDTEVLAVACAPTMVTDPPLAAMQVTGGQDSMVRRSYAPGDLISINAGTDNGIEVGQEYFTRRVVTQPGHSVSEREPGILRTSGWIRIYAVDSKMSLATITHACDTVDVGDYLDPLMFPTPPPPTDRLGKPERDNYGRIVTGADRRRTFAKGDFMLIDRGRDFGISVGSRFVVYRDKLQDKNFLYDLGEAVAVSVGAKSATLLILESRDAFQAGDYVGLRK